MYVSLDCCNGNTAARSCHPSFFISCCLTLVASKTGKPSLSASLCKPFRRAVGIGHWHRYIQVHVHGIRYIYRYIISRSWLETINPSRRDVIAIFGPLIGSLHGQICGDDITWYQCTDLDTLTYYSKYQRTYFMQSLSILFIKNNFLIN